MAAIQQIRCVKRTDRPARHEAISHIGGFSPSHGSRWKMDISYVISELEAGRRQFFVVVDGQAAEVAVAKTPDGHKYLKTACDTPAVDYLLSLPECQ
nr:DUF3892 domain-containing protein [Burkholderia lata]